MITCLKYFLHACVFGFFAGSQKIAVSPAWLKLGYFAWISQTTQHLIVVSKDFR